MQSILLFFKIISFRYFQMPDAFLKIAIAGTCHAQSLMDGEFQTGDFMLFVCRYERITDQTLVHMLALFNRLQGFRPVVKHKLVGAFFRSDGRGFHPIPAEGNLSL